MVPSILDIFKIGIAPSASHTMGPMTAAAQFLDRLRTGLSDPGAAEAEEARLRETRAIHPEGLPELRFDPDSDLVLDFGPPLPGHANGMILRAREPECFPTGRQDLVYGPPPSVSFRLFRPGFAAPTRDAVNAIGRFLLFRVSPGGPNSHDQEEGCFRGES